MAVPAPTGTVTDTPAARTPSPRGPGRWVLHPFFLAAYPVLFLFAQNTADQLSFDPVWLPLALALGGAAVALGLMTLAFRNIHAAAMAATVLIAAFFSFGHVWNLVGEAIGNPLILLVVWAVAVVAGLVIVIRLGSRARAWTGGLNVLAAIPLVLTLIPLGEFAISRGAAGAVISPVSGLLEGTEGEAKPDIYYLVFDRYAGSPALEKYFDFDNEPFLRELEDRGFSVARNSVANYVKTSLSLTSSLEMSYLDEGALKAEARNPADQEVINRRFQGRLAVPAELKSQGYRFVMVPSWWPPTATNVDADLIFGYEGPSEFALALMDTTLLSAFTSPREEIDPFSMDGLRNYTLHQLERMRDVPALPGPKFVMAHFLIPHPPTLFDRDGTGFEGAETSLSPTEKYTRQVEFTNSQILDIVDIIRSQPDDEEPIIVLQADEGPFPDRYAANGETFTWADATAEELEIKFRILNAVHLGGHDAEAAGFHDAITPVNEFRVVFNAIFDAGLPMLEERVYAHVDYKHFYDFIEVGDRIPGWPE